MYKVVCIDLDGTLLSKEKVVSSKSIEVLDKLIKKGINIIVATGRQFFMVERLLKDLNSDILVCANNGSMIRYKDSKELVVVNYVDKKVVDDVLEYAKKVGLSPYLYVDKYVENYNLVVENDAPKRTHFEDSLILEDTIRYFRDVDFDRINSFLCLAFLDKKEKISEMFDIYKDREDIEVNIYAVPDGRYVLEIQSIFADKWIAISKCIAQMNIDKKDVLVFGDEYNDENMIKNAGHSFAMKNGIEKIKKVADEITEYTNDEDGVRKELEKIFKDILN